MTKAFLMILLSFSWSSAQAAFEATNKYKLKSNNEIYDGFEKDGRVNLYNYNQRLLPTAVATSDVVFSTRSPVDGVRSGQTILIRTRYSVFAICTVETVFLDRQLAIFCDEIATVKGQPHQMRTHYRPTTNQVIAEQLAFAGITKNKVFELATNTREFRQGQKVRAIHIYANGLAIIEASYRKLLNRSLPERSELVELKLLK